MTKEEAIQQIGAKIAEVQSYINCAAYPEISYPNSIKFCEALGMAISALREQEERGKGCEFCKGAKYIYCEMSANGSADETHDFVHEWYGDVTICPMCGRRLEESNGS